MSRRSNARAKMRGTNCRCRIEDMNFKTKKGFTLVEAMVGIGLLSIVWIGVINIIVVGRAAESRARHKTQAMYVAQQAIEDLRKQPFGIDQHLSGGKPSLINGTYTAAVIIDDRGTTSASDDLNGTQVVTVSSPTTYYKQALVEIRWNEVMSGKNKSVTMHEYYGTFIANDGQVN